MFHCYHSNFHHCYSPFYGEDFSFEVPRDFQFLSFYVYDSDCFGLLRDSKLGKVCGLSSFTVG